VYFEYFVVQTPRLFAAINVPSGFCGSSSLWLRLAALCLCVKTDRGIHNGTDVFRAQTPGQDDLFGFALAAFRQFGGSLWFPNLQDRSSTGRARPCHGLPSPGF
jgi:hypothetical protein